MRVWGAACVALDAQRALVLGGAHGGRLLSAGDAALLESELDAETGAATAAADGGRAAPSPRQQLAACACGEAGSPTSVALFGGRAGLRRPLGDAWLLDLASREWRALAGQVDAPRPAARWRHAAASDGARLLVHGGLTGEGVASDTWELILAGGGRWRRVDAAGDAPPPLHSHAAALNAAADEFLVIGGLGVSVADSAREGDAPLYSLSLRDYRWRRLARRDANQPWPRAPLFSHAVARVGALLVCVGGVAPVGEPRIWALDPARVEWRAVRVARGASSLGARILARHCLVVLPRSATTLLVCGGGALCFAAAASDAPLLLELNLEAGVAAAREIEPPPAPRPALRDKEPPPPPHAAAAACARCGERFASRNRLFAHLREAACRTAAAE
jgi:hypothetical protein